MKMTLDQKNSKPDNPSQAAARATLLCAASRIA